MFLYTSKTIDIDRFGAIIIKTEGKMTRKPIVADQFYSADPHRLKKTIEGFREKETSKIDAKGVILPHAGYIYSGKVATITVEKIKPKNKVIVLGPNHTGLGKPFSMFAKGEWETPFGTIRVEEELAQQILSNSNIIEEDYAAHLHEHSIEVELPILYHFFGEFKLVPIVCATADLETYRKVAYDISKAVNNKSDILIVASSDMTHYEEDSQARKKDSIAIESIMKLDEENLLKQARKNNISMCGIAPVCILIACCKLLKAHKATVTLYQTSADTSGDYSSVVGYLGAVIY